MTTSCVSLLLCVFLTTNWMTVSDAVKYDWFGDTCQELAKRVHQANNPQEQATCASGCVAAGSIKTNEPCFFDSQCESNWCAPSWKICTEGWWNSNMPNAKCNPGCYESEDVTKCTCGHSDFPNNWVTCTDGSSEKDTCDPGRLPQPPPPYERLESFGGLVEDDEFAIAQQCFHNKFRQEAGLQPVEWDHSIAKFATHWLAHLKENNGMNMKHSSSDDVTQFDPSLPGLGENIYWHKTSSSTSDTDWPIFGANSAQAWYNEMKFFQYAGEDGGYAGCEMRDSVFPTTDGKQTGHMTALMWNTTDSIGCDYIKEVSGGWTTTLVLCNYSPQGNMAFNGKYLDVFGDKAYCLINANPETQELYGGLPYCKDGSIDCSPYESLAEEIFG